MRKPEGFEEKGTGWVWRLKRSLYGLKQAGRVWHEIFNERLEEIGFKRVLCVSIEWDRPNRIIQLSQCQYLLDLLVRFNFSYCSPVSTPLDPSIRLSTSMAPQSYEEEQQMRSIPYINAIGALAYLVIATSPDIAHSVGVLARFSQNPAFSIGRRSSMSFAISRAHSTTNSLILPLPFPPLSSSAPTLTLIMQGIRTLDAPPLAISS